MKKTFEYLKQDFNYDVAVDYKTFHRAFKREFTNYLKSLGAENIAVSKANWFDASGFFTVKNQIWYFSLSDLRSFKDKLLIRTAESYKDFQGGANQYASLASFEEFSKQFERVVGA